MKINSVAEDVERGNVAQERGFSIQANARAFQILSSNLYADKITAVIRELSCNALDSHVAAGKLSTPFDVHLPNALEPYFSVQDYGLGLSHDQVMSIYTTYFESTKTNTNELIGGLGLGSKSPFSYTNSFDVVSVHNGVSRSYAMFINEAGKPSVAFMGETPTDAPNGVRVSMPVKSTDFQAFQEKAARVFKWFSHRPVVTGSSRFAIPDLNINPDIQGTGWRIQGVDYHRGYGYYNQSGHPAVALMGNVAYPLKANVLDPKFQYLLNWPLIVDFAIGELDISASREDLSYDQVTVEVIEARLSKIMGELQQRIEQKFQEAGSLWEARLLLANMHADPTLRDILMVMQRGGFKTLWKGLEVTSDHIYWNRIFRGIDPKNPTVDPDPAPTMYDVSTYSRARNQNYVHPTSKVVFILKDVSDASARCKAAYYNKSQNAYLIEGVLNSDATKCPQVARLLKHLGDPPTILASSLGKVARKAMKFKGMSWTGLSRSWTPRKSDNWNPEQELTTTQGGFYITISGLDPVRVLGANNEVPVQLNDIVECARNLGIIAKNAQVWGINKTNSRLIKEEPNWINIYDFVEKKVHELINSNQTADMVHAREQYENVSQMFTANHEHWNKLFGKQDNSLGKFVQAWKQAYDVSTKVNLSSLRILSNCYNINLEDKVKNKGMNLMNMWHMAIKDYPMLKRFMRDHSSDQHWNLLTDYVNFVDTTKK